MLSKLSSSIELPSGLVLPNRLVKAAMGESMATNDEPGDTYITAYDQWGAGRWGGLLTGSVEVSTVYRGSNDDVAVRPTLSQATRDAWKRWALAAQRQGTPTIVQIVHPGRQSPAGAGTRSFSAPAIAPSPIPLNLGDSVIARALAKLVFGTPKEMTLVEIKEVVQQFASAAKLAYESDFKGVQLHAAHGFLLTAFLSPQTNIRTDDYGGSPANRARIVIEIIHAIRAVVPPSFSISIKLNSADIASAENLDDSLEQVGLFAAESIDFLELSGGSFEDPTVLQHQDLPKSARTVEREAFFLDYAREVRKRYPELLLMVTGGFRSRTGMEHALRSGACDLIGVGRPAAVWPQWPKDVLLNEGVKDEDARVQLAPAKPVWWLRWVPMQLVGVGADTLYYVGQIQALAMGRVTAPPPVV